jgi:hypothetical protein
MLRYRPMYFACLVRVLILANTRELPPKRGWFSVILKTAVCCYGLANLLHLWAPIICLTLLYDNSAFRWSILCKHSLWKHPRVLHLSGRGMRYKVLDIKLKIRLSYWRVCCHVVWWVDTNNGRNFWQTVQNSRLANSEDGDIVPPKRRHLCIEDHNHTSQRTVVLTFIAVRNANMTTLELAHGVTLWPCCSHSIIREKSEQKSYKIFSTKTTWLPERVCQAYTLCSRTLYDFWKSVSGT